MKANELGWAKEATTFSIAGTEPSNRNFQGRPNRMGLASRGFKPSIQSSPSVRGKKGLARSRAPNTYSKSAINSKSKPSSQIE